MYIIIALMLWHADISICTQFPRCAHKLNTIVLWIILICRRYVFSELDSYDQTLIIVFDMWRGVVRKKVKEFAIPSYGKIFMRFVTLTFINHMTNSLNFFRLWIITLFSHKLHIHYSFTTNHIHHLNY